MSNQPTLLGALKYNTNSLLGWSFGNPSFEEVMLYSDFVLNSWIGTKNNTFTNVSDVSGINPIHSQSSGEAYSDEVLQFIFNGFWGEETKTRLYLGLMQADEYKVKYAKADGLFGLTFLPWNLHGIHAGDYVYFKRDISNNAIMLNPLRSEVLYIKLITTLKIVGVSLPIFLLIKHFVFKKAQPKKSI